MPKGDRRISKMWEVRWRRDDVEHRRACPSKTEALTVLRREASRGAVPIGEPIELEDRWFARWRDSRGKGRKRSFSSYKAARAHLVAEDGKRARNEWHDPRGGRRAFGEVAAEVAATRAGRRASTLARDESVMRSLVLPTFAEVRIGDISTEAVEVWIGGLVAQGRAVATVQKAFQLLAVVMRHAARRRWIPGSPCEDVDLSEILPEVDHVEQRFLDGAEIGHLADAIDPRYRALVLTAAYTGARFGELAALRVGHIEFLRRVKGNDGKYRNEPAIRIEETLNEVRGHIVLGPPKTKKARRTISLPAFLVDVLAEQVAGRQAGDFVFCSPGGGPLRRNQFRRRFWIAAVMGAGLPHSFERSEREGVCTCRLAKGAKDSKDEPIHDHPLRFHDLRHSHAALLIAEGVHPRVLADRLGHASIRTTLDVYGHVLEGLDQGAADALEQTYRAAEAKAPQPAVVAQIGGR